jgi:hypothetical protein
MHFGARRHEWKTVSGQHLTYNLKLKSELLTKRFVCQADCFAIFRASFARKLWRNFPEKLDAGFQSVCSLFQHHHAQQV